MSHIAFNEAYMGSGDPLKGSRIPGFGAGNRTAPTQRVERNRAKTKAPLKPVRKGMARSCVSVKAVGTRKFEVRVKGSLNILGYIRGSQGKQGKSYSYQIIGEKAHNGFASQRAAVERMLEKC